MSHRPCRQDERRQSHSYSQHDNHRGFIHNERDRPGFRSQHHDSRPTCRNDEQGRRRSRSREPEVGSDERWRDGRTDVIQTRPTDFATRAAAGCATHFALKTARPRCLSKCHLRRYILICSSGFCIRRIDISAQPRLIP